MAENKHQREITAGDGVSDHIAIWWSELEHAARTWGLEGRHRAPHNSD